LAEKAAQRKAEEKARLAQQQKAIDEAAQNRKELEEAKDDIAVQLKTHLDTLLKHRESKQGKGKAFEDMHESEDVDDFDDDEEEEETVPDSDKPEPKSKPNKKDKPEPEEEESDDDESDDEEEDEDLDSDDEEEEDDEESVDPDEEDLEDDTDHKSTHDISNALRGDADNEVREGCNNGYGKTHHDSRFQLSRYSQCRTDTEHLYGDRVIQTQRS
jgi:hypothetical protein